MNILDVGILKFRNLWSFQYGRRNFNMAGETFQAESRRTTNQVRQSTRRKVKITREAVRGSGKEQRNAEQIAVESRHERINSLCDIVQKKIQMYLNES